MLQLHNVTISKLHNQKYTDISIVDMKPKP